MSLDIQVSEDPNNFETAEVVAHIDPGSRLHFFHAELGHHEIVNGKEAQCFCNLTFVFDV